jgi:hypothetical protein
LTSIEPLIETHAGNYFGVTDNFSESNASNYLMYAGLGNKQYEEIVIQCTQTLPDVYNSIHDPVVFELAVSTLSRILEGNQPDIEAIQTILDSCKLKSINIQPKHFFYTLCMAVEFTIGSSTEAGMKISEFLRPNSHNRMKSTFVSHSVVLLYSLRSVINPILSDINFKKMWNFARTDMYLNTIMHRSNLPIFCNIQKIPIYLLPFSYLLRYSCFFSFVGHLGDGSSYGMSPTRRFLIKEFCR